MAIKNTYTFELRILAHRVLRQLTGMALVVSEHGQKDKDLYMQKSFFPSPIINIRAAIQDKTYEEIYNAVLLLVKNGHATIKKNNLDIFKSIVEVLPDGEDAYKSDYYLKLNKDDADENRDKWQKRNWAWIAAFSFVLGVITDANKETLKCQSPKTAISPISDSTSDTSLVRIRTLNNDTSKLKDTNLLHIDTAH
mgnify:CR=1 FL=1